MLNRPGVYVDSLVYLQEQLIRLQRKYAARPRYCALRMTIASMHALFMRYTKNMQPLKIGDAKEKPSIVFFVKGGLGDLVIARNYIYHFYQCISKKPFQLKIAYHYENLLADLGPLPGLTQIATDVDALNGVLKIELNRYPRILAGNVEKLSAYIFFFFFIF